METRIEEIETRVAAAEGGSAIQAAGPTDPPSPAREGPPEEAEAQRAAIERGPDDNSRENPIPIGEAGQVGDWTITVRRVRPDATNAVLAENRFNDPPLDGRRFFMIRVSLTYGGVDSKVPWADLSLEAVGASNVAYTTDDPGCGVIPDNLNDVNEVFSGGTIEGNICFQIDQTDVDSLVLYVEPSFSLDDDRVWFALR